MVLSGVHTIRTRRVQLSDSRCGCAGKLGIERRAWSRITSIPATRAVSDSSPMRVSVRTSPLPGPVPGRVSF